tara:strand:+ start:153 stop:329 length:177 start_codon:yes stop_codon:yes gene_type:complete
MISITNPVPAEVEKPLDFSTSSEPLIRAWNVEETYHAFIFATTRLLTTIKRDILPPIK